MCISTSKKKRDPKQKKRKRGALVDEPPGRGKRCVLKINKLPHTIKKTKLWHVSTCET